MQTCQQGAEGKELGAARISLEGYFLSMSMRTGGALHHLAGLLEWAHECADTMTRVVTCVKQELVDKNVKVTRAVVRALPVVVNVVARLKARVAKTASTNAINLQPPSPPQLNARDQDSRAIGAVGESALEQAATRKEGGRGKRKHQQSESTATFSRADWPVFARRHWDEAQKNAMLAFTNEWHGALDVSPRPESVQLMGELAFDRRGDRDRSGGNSLRGNGMEDKRPTDGVDVSGTKVGVSTEGSGEGFRGGDRPRVFGLEWDVVDVGADQTAGSEPSAFVAEEDDEDDVSGSAGTGTGWGLYSYKHSTAAVSDSESSFVEDEFDEDSSSEDDDEDDDSDGADSDVFDRADAPFTGGSARKRPRR